MTVCDQNRNMLIRAYRGAGDEYVAYRFELLLGSDEQINSRGGPALRDDAARELQDIMGDAGMVGLLKTLAQYVILNAQERKEGEQSNG